MILNDLPWKQSKQTNQVHSVIFEIASKFCRDMLSKSLIQFSVDGWGCVVSLLFGLRPNCWPMPPPETPGHSQVSLTQCLVWTLLFSPGSWCTQGLVCALQESVSSVLWKFYNQITLALKDKLSGGSQSFARSQGWEIWCGSQNFLNSARISLV